PKVDGDGGDAAWASAAQIGQLARGGSMNTTVRLCHDGQTLYILAACKERPGRTPKAKEDTRDGRVWDDDCIELRIETLTKNTPQHVFIVNIAGVLYDAAGMDAFYNPDWSAVVKRGESQWTLEAAIPAAAVGLKQWQREIGFNIGRNVPGVGNQSWNPSWQDASSSRLALEGAPEAAAGDEKELVSSPNVTVSGSSLRIRLDRPYARPAERWIEATLQLKPKAALAQTRLDVKLFPLAKTEPVEKLSVTPTGAHAALRVDLRSAKLEKGEVALELFEGNERTGAVKAFVSAQSETPVKAGWKIAVTLDAPEGVGGLKDWPVTFGVPFAAGTLWDAKQLRLVNKSGREIPCQKEVTGRWARDGAIQWVRFDALVTPEDGCFVEVAEPSAPSTPLRVTEDGQGVTVDTGAARYVLGKGASPIREVWLAGRKVASSDGTRGLYVVDQTGKLASASADGETMAVEARGPVAACVRFEGFYRTSDGQELARHITRVECFAGQPAASITHTLVLTNDTNKVWFKEIGWEFAVSPGASPQALFGLSPDQHEKRLSIPLSDAAKSACMLQDSHYVFAHGKNHFSVAVGGATRHEGEECGDWAALVGRDAGLQMVCRDAARQ
ncbi:MAG: hypothetical protein FJ272_18440, partial [Planctomycetes bacterium]|nr:hypothetical protein [Planctomycetota bacterium]